MLPEVSGLELLVIAVAALIVVGPKDLPVLLRRFGQFMAKLRGMAAEFRASFDEMARQSELDDLRKEVEAMRRGQFGEIAQNAGVADMQSTISEIDQSLADVGVDLNTPSYHYQEPEALAAPEADPPKVRKPRAKKVTIAEAPAAPKAPKAASKASAKAPKAKPIVEGGPRRSKKIVEGGALSDYDPDAEIEASRAPLLDHLTELRSRLIICVGSVIAGFAICFAFAKQIYSFLLYPFEMAARMFSATKGAHGGEAGPFDLLFVLVGIKEAPAATENLKLVFTAPLEFFFTQLKLAGFGAVILTFPILAWQVYAFVAPGLYKKERRAFLPFLLAAPLLFLAGAALVYFIILPFVLWFSLNQQIVGAGNISVELLPKVSDYLTLVTTLLLAFGLCFQLPVVLTLLGLAGMVNSSMLWKGWRYAVFGVVVVAAVVTPPDPISQLLLAVPIIGLYFVSIGCVKLIELRRKDDEPESTA